MLKHGFLIIAHAYLPQLERIIELLSSPNHYFFINVDKKTLEGTNFIMHCKQSYSNVFFLEGKDRMSVAHGGYSQVECFMRLLKCAVQQNMDYFHFISGQDYPCQPNEEFDAFFEKNVGRSYMHMDSEAEAEEWKKEKYPNRVKCYRFLDIPYRNVPFVKFAVRVLNKVGSYIPRKAIPNLWGGWNWVSWYRNVAEYVLKQEKANPNYFKRFHYTSCSDELIFVTMLRPLAEELNIETENSLRYIDWKKKAEERGVEKHPLILNEEEYEDIISSGAFFCRKIQPEISAKLIQLLEKNQNKR